MTLDIIVRGSAQQHHPAERAVVTMAAVIEGADRLRVLADAVAVQEPLVGQLKELVTLHAVQTWSSDQVRVFSHRPYEADGARGALVHVARVQVQAEFTDFERLSGFLDHWSGVDGVEIGGVTWDVTAKNRRLFEAEARKGAVDDAVAKAQAYADAVRRGKVTAVQLADPGMLAGQDDRPAAVFARASADLGGSGASLDLTPGEIVIRVEVDARFSAD